MMKNNVEDRITDPCNSFYSSRVILPVPPPVYSSSPSSRVFLFFFFFLCVYSFYSSRENGNGFGEEEMVREESNFFLN
jgi:hypothetical protein